MSYTSTGDGVSTAAPPTLNETFQGKNYKAPVYDRGTAEQAPKAISQTHTRGLNKIEVALLLYTGSHNIWNAFHRVQESMLWFIFVAGGVICMEYFLYKGGKAYVGGEFTFKQKKIFKWWGSAIFLFIAMGVLAAGQSADAATGWWLDFHYHWILPVGTLMLLPAFYHLRSADEIMTARTEGQALRFMAEAEKERERYAQELHNIIEQRNYRVSLAKIRNQLDKKLDSEINSWSTSGKIKIEAKSRIPKLLTEAGIGKKKEEKPPVKP